MSNDDSSPASGLASRLRAAIDNRLSAAREAREAERRRREAAELARKQLLNDLAAFGKAIGHFDVSHKRERVVFRFEGRSLCFEADGDLEQVSVSGDEINGRNVLFIQEPLGKWVWSHKPRRGPERRLMLFDQGLEALIALALKIRPANPSSEPETSTDGRTIKRSL